MDNFRIINTDASNIDNFGMCGYKNKKHVGFKRKLEWNKDRFAEGMKYKMLVDASGNSVGGIEYIPGEYAWRPVKADGYMFIHCIYIMKKDAKGKGYGEKLVQECIDDARKLNMKGVAVVTRKGSWMAGVPLFEKLGFKVTDAARPDFKLLALKFDLESCSPKFSGNWSKTLKNYGEGLTIITSDQCPYLYKSISEIIEVAKNDFGIIPNMIHLENSSQAKQVPCAFGSFCMIYNGKVVAENPISKTRFRNIMKKERTEDG
jgi:L-amino acid N-acyltransferase YncA